MWTDPARVRVLVKGRVQGVWFRQSTLEQAQARGVCGWVRNLPDGRVEILAEGERHDLTALLEWARIGPALAHVIGTQVDWEPFLSEFKDFQVV